MTVLEVELKGVNSPVRLLNIGISDKGIIVKRPLGSGAMAVRSNAIEVNYPLTKDKDLELFPKNANEVFAIGTEGETLYLIMQEGGEVLATG